MSYGKVCTGFSAPYVAKYNNAGGTVTYTDGMRLARGVSVSISPEVGDDNTFYADNIAAETEDGVFTGGSVKLTVDGLHSAAETFIYGLPAADEITVGDKVVKVRKYGNKMSVPYVGIGVVVEYRSDGVTTYAPVILTKGRFKTNGTEAQTREDTTSWQTQDLEATIARDDTPEHNWKWVAEDQSTEAEAIAIIESIFNVAQASQTVHTKES